MKKILVVIPTFNEAENIQNVIKEVLSLSNDYYIYNVLVVDDNSPDGTASLVESLNNENIFIIRRKGKLGLGTAYLKGFKFALEKNYDYVFEMDADFSHDPRYLPVFITEIEKGYDLVVGSRYINGISVVNWPMGRLLLSYFANIYTRIITGLQVKDTTAGFMCYKVTSLSNINLDNIKSNGYSFQIEMKYKFYKKKFNISEIPILFIERRAGVSKMSKRVVYEAMFMVWKLKFRSIFNKL
jgi:dolichol-phosphate mannosyltransferase